VAKQVGPIFFTGSVSDLCFYKLEGKYYVREKSSLSRKHVLKDPAFKKTMESAGLLGRASVIASKLYQSMDKKKRSRRLYQMLTGKVIILLKDGKNEQEIISMLKN
jgi:hypothetical protein